MIVYIAQDELWPVYQITDCYDETVATDLSQDELDFIGNADQNFFKAQEILERAWKSGGGK